MSKKLGPCCLDGLALSCYLTEVCEALGYVVEEAELRGYLTFTNKFRCKHGFLINYYSFITFLLTITNALG